MTARPLHDFLEHIAAYTIAVHGDISGTISAVHCDSRLVEPDSIFVAVDGARANGVDYIPQAVAAGARVIVADKPLPPLPPGVVAVEVSQTYAVLARLAEMQYDFPSTRLKVYGITGTNGKTTSAYILRDIFRAAGIRTGMIGTVCYDCGDEIIAADRTTPPPLLLQQLLAKMVAAGIEVVVMEFSSHALVQRRYGGGRVAGAIFTNLTGDHLDYHQDLEQYYQAKRLLFSEVLADGATAVVNSDDPTGARLQSELRATGAHKVIALTAAGVAGATPSAPVAQINELRSGVAGTSLTLTSSALPTLRLQSPLIGSYNAYNLAGAAALALDAGIAPALIQAAISDCRGAPGRLEAYATPHGATVFVDYAHTDDALQNVLTALRQLQPRRLSVVFGCGGDRDRSKRPRMGRVAAELADQVWVTSDNPRSENPQQIIAEICAGIAAGSNVKVEADRRRAIAAAVTGAGAGQIVLIAGKGHETYQEINGQTFAFDDAAEVRGAIAALTTATTPDQPGQDS